MFSACQKLPRGNLEMNDTAGIKALLIHPRDNVAVALEDVSPGAQVPLSDGRVVTAKTEIPQAHKIALKRIDSGGAVVKYGEIIGFAKLVIEEGEWVHTHNLSYEE